jgi:hypothetical protein
MKLVKLENYQVVFEDELLLLKPFRQLYKADKNRDKRGFMDFLTIIYYTYDPRSDYSYIVNENQRLKEVCETNGLDIPKYSDLQKECIELYKKLTTTISYELLKSTKIAISKVKDFLENVDLAATDDKGKPVYTINSITTAIRQIPQLAKDVMDAEKAVAKEIQEQGTARGGNDSKSIMEDGVFNW